MDAKFVTFYEFAKHLFPLLKEEIFLQHYLLQQLFED